MKTIPTWGQRSQFEYEGSVTTGTKIYGRNAPVITITKEDYVDILNHFAGKIENIGTSFDKPPVESLGWYMMQKGMIKSSPTAYVGAILVEEGYAVRYKRGIIKFIK